MAIDDPAKVEEDPWKIIVDYLFLGIYTIEMVLKILGFGFIFNKGAYIRDAWNILDFVIVLSGYVELFVTSTSLNLGVLWSFWVLRPLRTISGIEGLWVLVSALLQSIPLLRDTLMILLFFFFIMGIAGL